MRTATQQPEGDDSGITENKRVASSSGGQPGEGGTDPDSGNIQRIHRSRDEGGGRIVGADRDIADRVAPLGGDNGGSGGEEWVFR